MELLRMSRLTEMTPPPPEWLADSPTTISELRVRFSDSETPKSIRTGMSETLDAIERLLVEGDLLYRFSSPQESWQRKMGISGIAIKRGNEIVKSIVLIMN